MWCVRLTLRGDTWPALHSAADTSRGLRAPHPHICSAQAMGTRSIFYGQVSELSGFRRCWGTGPFLEHPAGAEVYSSLILHEGAAATALTSPLEGREMRFS